MDEAEELIASQKQNELNQTTNEHKKRNAVLWFIYIALIGAEGWFVYFHFIGKLVVEDYATVHVVHVFTIIMLFILNHSYRKIQQENFQNKSESKLKELQGETT